MSVSRQLCSFVSVLALTVILWQPDAAVAQETETAVEREQVDIAAKALRHVLDQNEDGSFESGPITIDPRIAARAHLPREKAWVGRWTPDEIARLAETISATVESRETALNCAGGPHSCALRDAGVSLALTRPDVSDGQAKIFVDVIYQASGERAFAYQTELSLTREGGEWRVVQSHVVAKT